MITPTPEQVREAQKTLSKSGGIPLEQVEFIWKQVVEFLLSSLPKPEVGDKAVIATADICPHGTSSSLCEWCGYRTQVTHLLKDRTQSQAEIASLKAEVREYRDGLKWYAQRGIWTIEIKFLLEGKEMIGTEAQRDDGA